MTQVAVWVSLQRGARPMPLILPQPQKGFHAYLKERDVPHIRNVDDEGHTPETWGSNLYHFAQRIFR